MLVTTKSIVKINGKDHYSDKVVLLARTGPIVDLKLDDIYYNGTSDICQSTDKNTIIFHKENGMYAVLAGNEVIKKITTSPKFKGTVSGYLISSVVLKRARVS